MGQYCWTLDRDETLDSGKTRADFQSVGKTPCIKEKLKMLRTTGSIYGSAALKSMTGISQHS